MELTIDQALHKAIEAHKAGKVEEAERLYTAILKAQPRHPDANHNMGVLAVGVGKVQQALPFFKTALEANAGTAQFWLSYVDALIKLDRLADARAVFDQAKENGAKGDGFNKLEQRLGALKQEPDEPITDRNEIEKGQPNILDTLKLDQALKLAKKKSKDGSSEEARNIYQDILTKFPKNKKAIDGMKALSVEPMEKTAKAQDPMQKKINQLTNLYNRGDLEAVVELAQELTNKYPNAFMIWNLLGAAAAQIGKPNDAIKALKKVTLLNPNFAEGHNNFGNLLKDQGKLEEAIEAYNKSLSINPNFQGARSQKLHIQAQVCDWVAIENDRDWIPPLGTKKQHVSPFSLLSLEDSPKNHFLRSKIFAKKKFTQRQLPNPPRPSQKPKRLRVGYFSSDFKEHPVTYLITKMLSLHNREKFEVFAYSFDGSTGDPWRQKVIDAVDVFRNVKEMSDHEIALLARQDKIHIAIDLNGYTRNNRAGIFAFRAAPIQMTYLGIAMTMGTDFIDYLIADRISIPSEMASYYSENIMYLPNCYQVNDNSIVVPDISMTRSEMGLPEQGFVFCCFNQSYKITSNVFDIWMRVLHRVERSVLWLAKSNKWSERNLIKEAKNRGIAGDRLIFADRLPLQEHTARHKLADLFIDTFNFNAGATASSALWAGLPIVTKMGKGFATRVSGSMLSAIGLDELITKNEHEYEDLILELATNPDRLLTITKKLKSNKLSTPLFDTELFTKYIEEAYKLAYENYFDGMDPKQLFINREQNDNK